MYSKISHFLCGADLISNQDVVGYSIYNHAMVLQQWDILWSLIHPHVSLGACRVFATIAMVNFHQIMNKILQDGEQCYTKLHIPVFFRLYFDIVLEQDASL